MGIGSRANSLTNHACKYSAELAVLAEKENKDVMISSPTSHEKAYVRTIKEPFLSRILRGTTN